MRFFFVAGMIASAALVATIVTAMPRKVVSEPIKPESVKVRQIALEIEPLKKQDRLPLFVAPPVAAMVAVAALEMPEQAPPVQDKQPKLKREHRHDYAESDICTRHNMHKVITSGGRSWRCRR